MSTVNPTEHGPGVSRNGLMNSTVVLPPRAPVGRGKRFRCTTGFEPSCGRREPIYRLLDEPQDSRAADENTLRHRFVRTAVDGQTHGPGSRCK